MAPGRKRKAPPKPSTAARPPRAEVDRLIERGKFKDAVKQAKLCYRDQPTAEHHRLLERAYLLRARQLLDGGMPSAAQEVAHHLISFGVTDPEGAASASELLVEVGLTEQAMALHRQFGEDPDTADRLQREASDQAILHPDRASGLPIELREGAALIRQALDRIQSGEAEAARVLLNDVPRRSPFGEWKRFALGLIAFHQRDQEQTSLAWDRLDPARAPSRIASNLRLLDAPDTGSPPPPALEAIERQTLGAAVLQPLHAIAGLIAENRWPEALQAIRSLRPALRAIDPKLSERLTQILADPAIQSIQRLGFQPAMQAIKELTGALEPLPIDPRWNRFLALLWEGPQGSAEDAERYWRAYLTDLDTCAAIRDDERPMARAIVLRHLGSIHAHESDELVEHQFDGTIHMSDACIKAHERAVARLEEALACCPTDRQTYHSLIQLHRHWDEDEQAAAVHRRLVEAFPDDVDSLLDLAFYYQDRDDPGQALAYIQQARALRPLDTDAATLEWNARVSLARHLALKRRFADARRELDTAAALLPERSRSPHFLARRVVLELKASREEAAQERIDEARGLIDEPAPLWLAILIEARRYRLTKPKREPFETLWSEALAQKPHSRTAALLADLLNPFILGGVRYTGRETHLRQVTAYLKRTTRLTYGEEDLTAVCAFLGHVRSERKLLETLARKGERAYPNAPQFPTFLGTLEMEKGPFRGNLSRARSWLEKAMKLAEARAATDPRANTLIPKLRGFLADLDQIDSRSLGFFESFFGDRQSRTASPDPAGPLPAPDRLPPEMQAMLDAMELAGIRPEDLLDPKFDLDDEFDLDDDLDDEFDDSGPFLFPTPRSGPQPSPRRPRAPKPSKKKKKR